ncbi:hypothetical protein GCM10027610_054980 [Dactylosporangium cerinum]
MLGWERCRPGIVAAAVVPLSDIGFLLGKRWPEGRLRMVLPGVLVFMALLLICAVTTLCIASRLAHPDERPIWHLHRHLHWWRQLKRQ